MIILSSRLVHVRSTNFSPGAKRPGAQSKVAKKHAKAKNEGKGEKAENSKRPKGRG